MDSGRTHRLVAYTRIGRVKSVSTWNVRSEPKDAGGQGPPVIQESSDELFTMVLPQSFVNSLTSFKALLSTDRSGLGLAGQLRRESAACHHQVLERVGF